MLASRVNSSHSLIKSALKNVVKSFNSAQNAKITQSHSPPKRFLSFSKPLKMSQNTKEFVLELNTPFEELECSEAFENLTEKERKYLHYYSKVRKY
jgi:hypothetical protein